MEQKKKQKKKARLSDSPAAEWRLCFPVLPAQPERDVKQETIFGHAFFLL